MGVYYHKYGTASFNHKYGTANWGRCGKNPPCSDGGTDCNTKSIWSCEKKRDYKRRSDRRGKLFFWLVVLPFFVLVVIPVCSEIIELF